MTIWSLLKDCSTMNENARFMTFIVGYSLQYNVQIARTDRVLNDDDV